MAKILQIVVDSPLRQRLDYLPATDLTAADYAIGCRCQVPFGRRRVSGIVLGHAADSELDAKALKRAGPPQEPEPLLHSDDLALLAWISSYYLYPLGSTLFTLLPSHFASAEPRAPYQQRRWQLTSKGHGLADAGLQRAPRQRALLDLLANSEQGLSDSALKAAGFTLNLARELEKKDLLASTVSAHSPANCRSLQQGSASQQALSLNAEQREALEQCYPASDAPRQFSPLLLEGVTGSGKTEVYLQAAARALAEQRQVLLLVPEIALTPQTITRFAVRFDCLIATMHSGLNDRERAAAWLAVQSGEARILIGTRSAVATPMPELGLIIVDEEHDTSFKQQDGLRYNARDVAVWRAKQQAVPIVLGSATPSLETQLNANGGRYQLAVLQQRNAGGSPAQIEFIDTRKQQLSGGLSEAAIEALATTLEAGRQAMVFINRRGYAPQLLCHDCGWSGVCQHCDARLTYHKKRAVLRCHHCDAQQAVPPQCPRCQSRRLQPVGEGTEQCEETLARLFPGIPLIRIDRDSVRSAAMLEQSLENIASRDAAILVGTQILAKGHHFPKLDTVVMLNIDAGLYGSDFRSIERTLQLLTQVSGRAGRESSSGRVLLQSHLADHPLLALWQQAHYAEVASELLEERATRALPPFNQLAIIAADSPNADGPRRFLRQVVQIVQQADPEQRVAVVGPLAALMERRAGRHRYFVLLKAAERSALQQTLRASLAAIDALPRRGGLRWQLDIDPQQMP